MPSNQPPALPDPRSSAGRLLQVLRDSEGYRYKDLGDFQQTYAELDALGLVFRPDDNTIQLNPGIEHYLSRSPQMQSPLSPRRAGQLPVSYQRAATLPPERIKAVLTELVDQPVAPFRITQWMQVLAPLGEATCYSVLSNLNELGLIVISPRKPRTVRITEDGSQWLQEQERKNGHR